MTLPSKHRGKHTKWEYSAQIPKYVTHELFCDTQEKYENKQRQDITKSDKRPNFHIICKKRDPKKD